MLNSYPYWIGRCEPTRVCASFVVSPLHLFSTSLNDRTYCRLPMYFRLPTSIPFICMSVVAYYES